MFDSLDDALELVERAEKVAVDNGQREFARIAASYRAMHLAVGRRFDEAAAIARPIYASRRDDGLGYGAYSALAGLAAHQILAGDPDAREWATVLETTPSRNLAPWGNQLTAAALHAAEADTDEVRRLVGFIRRRLNQAGFSPLPDLLLPIAVLAHRLGEDEAARQWVWAVKSAGRPTQSFQMTILYRRLQETLGDDDERPPGPRSLEEVGEEALSWLAVAGGGQPSPPGAVTVPRNS